MNMSQNYGEDQFDHVEDRRPSRSSRTQPNQSRRARTDSRRRGKAPSQFNGIHRRRKKRITW